VDALIALVRKDLRLYFSNRRALLVTLAAPILIAAFFGSVMGGSPKTPSGVAVAVVDEDRSEVSRAIVAGLRADGSLKVELLDAAAARERVHAGKTRAAIVIPRGFGADSTRALFRPRGGKPEIELLVDPSQYMATGLVKGVFTQRSMQEIARAAFSPQRGLELVNESRDAIRGNPRLDARERDSLLALFDSIERVQKEPGATEHASAAGFSMPFEFRESDVTSGARPYNAFAHSFAGMGVQFVLFMGIELGVGLLLMRRTGIWKRLRAAPVSRSLLLGSRIASGTLIATLLLAGIYAAGIAFFRVRIDGSVAGFVGIALAFAVMTSTFGLLIAAIGRTPEATRGLAILATLLLVMLGGAWVPAFVFPEWLQKATLWVPTRWAVDGLEAMSWRGLGPGDAVAPVAVLLAYAVAFGAVAVARFRWEE
jgi:ABC-2 type transport system permease protein